jgi:hypothetical protein
MFRVEWRESTQVRLTDEWLKADSKLRAAITTATYDIDRKLSFSPEKTGESREPGTRVLIVSPLTVTFHVNIRTRTVLISGVSVHRSRPQS